MVSPQIVMVSVQVLLGYRLDVAALLLHSTLTTHDGLMLVALAPDVALALGIPQLTSRRCWCALLDSTHGLKGSAGRRITGIGLYVQTVYLRGAAATGIALHLLPQLSGLGLTGFDSHGMYLCWLVTVPSGKVL